MSTQEPKPPTGNQPPIIIYNSSAASAAASATTVAVVRRRRQSGWVHFWLFLFTAGIGNIIYAIYISRWNRNHGV